MRRFGVVIDRKTLNKLLLSVASVFITIGSFVVALQPGEGVAADDATSGMCVGVSAAQEAAIAAFRAANQSCAYNITVNGHAA